MKILFIIYANLKGRKDIHVKFINRSYRIRGRVPRIIINIAIIKILWAMRIEKDKIGLPIFCINRVLDKIDTNIIFMYSDMKMKANDALAYSVLKPETSSLSPSVKSKGVRLVSAKRHVNQIYNITGAKNIILNILLFIVHWMFILLIRIRVAISQRAKVTSYEIVWATLRKVPRRAYLEFDDQPIPIVV